MRKNDGVETIASEKSSYVIVRKNDGVETIASEKSSYVDVRKNDGVETIASEKSSCVDVRKNDGVEITATDQRNRRCHDADVTPIVRDPMDDDRIPVESGAEIVPVPHEPSESEKMTHGLTLIPFQPRCTLCVRGKTQAERHKRTERIIEDSELPWCNATISC